jgi:hypothetical protein
MSKLHELLAVEPDLKKKAELMLEEAKVTFEKRTEHFTELRKTYKPDLESGLEQPEDVKAMVETVQGKLAYLSESQSEFLDAVFQKELTNTKAKADIILDDGSLLASKVPATVLLGLENRLRLLREVFIMIPTLPPGEDWKHDPDTGYYSVIEKKVRTKKVIKNHVATAATDKHPAQVQIYNEDEREGLAVTIKTTSVFSPGDKSKLLTRLDLLQKAVKQARQRANNEEVCHGKIGKTIFNYLYGLQQTETKTQ